MRDAHTLPHSLQASLMTHHLKAKMLNVSKISCEDMIHLKNVDLLSSMTMLQILPRVLPPLLLLLLLFEVGEFPL